MPILGANSSGGSRPSAPVIGSATDGGTGTTASVAFTPSSYIGKGTITYTATSSPGSITATSSSSPITVSGLTTGTAYTFTVQGSTNYGVTSAVSSSSNSIAPAAPTAYESIVSGTATTAAGITFSSIPQTYKHLQIRLNWTVSGGQVRLRLNNDNATFHRITANGTSATAQYFSANEIMATVADLEGSYPGVAIIDVLDYASTTKTKTVRIFSGNNTAAAGQVGMYSQLYTSTAAITSIVLDTNGSGVTGTTAIYGIKG